VSAPDGAGGTRGVGTGTHQDLGVTVQRDLTGSGRLARGGETRFSSLRLRSVGRAAPPAGADAADGAPAAPSLARAEEAGEAEDEASTASPSFRAEEAPARAASPVRRLLRWMGLG
jgi:hypothetical protein